MYALTLASYRVKTTKSWRHWCLAPKLFPRPFIGPKLTGRSYKEAHRHRIKLAGSYAEKRLLNNHFTRAFTAYNTRTRSLRTLVYCKKGSVPLVSRQWFHLAHLISPSCSWTPIREYFLHEQRHYGVWIISGDHFSCQAWDSRHM